MSYYNSKRNIAHAAAALGVGFSGAAQAGTTTSTVPAGFTPVVFTLGPNSASFDPSGAGLDVIGVGGQPAFSGKQGVPGKYPGIPAKPGTLTFSNNNAGATIATDSVNGFAAAYATIPDTYVSFGQGGTVTVAKDTTSNFTTTPMFGETSYSLSDGTTGYGYFQGTYDGANFTLLDYGVFTPAAIGAAPEPETWALLALGFGGIGAMRRRQRRKQRPIEAIAA